MGLGQEAGPRVSRCRHAQRKGEGFVDYVLWGDDGKPLGLVEAKRTKRDARVGQQQAKLYADCLEKQFGQRPIIFYSNGSEHWIWDDQNYPPRSVQGFYVESRTGAVAVVSRWHVVELSLRLLNPI